MSLRDTIRRATQGIVPKLLGEMAGSTVTTTRSAKSRDQAGRPSNAKTHPIVDGAWWITEIADAKAQRAWGIQSNASAQAAVPLGTDVQEDDVVRVTAGDFAGELYEVEQLRRDPLGSRILVALGPTGQTP